jgi:DnaJ-class molecular chaperone
MRDEEYQTCAECQGEGRYYLVGEDARIVPPGLTTPVMFRYGAQTEHIDPCDYCNGGGQVHVPVVDDDEYEQPGLFA